MKSYPMILLLFTLIVLSNSKSEDYARHLELSLLFYEAQRSGALPKTNRIFWRFDSSLDVGKKEGLDLSGGYYDAGDNVKFNLPQGQALSVIAYSGLEFEEGYKKANQWKYLLDTVKWGADYFINCHPKKDVLYVTVGDGNIDHQFWYPPEMMNYEIPLYKIDPEHPGSEVTGDMAATLAAASILFKKEDSAYSATLLKHAIEIFELAERYRGGYAQSIPEIRNFYSTDAQGFYDELEWAALWLYRATEDSKYREKFEEIANADYNFRNNQNPLNWDNVYPVVYTLAAQLLGDKYLDIAKNYAKNVLNGRKTPGGLYWSGYSNWGSNRYGGNAGATLLFLANMLKEGDSERNEYIKFAEGQMKYILGDNPLNINYVVGGDETSPKSVHHRGASFTYAYEATDPLINVHPLWGGLAGGPGEDDSYKDDRNDYQKNEVALDYNAGFTCALAGLVKFGLGKADPESKLNFEDAWPYKAPTPDVTIAFKNSGKTVTLEVSTDSGMKCGSFCVGYKSSNPINSVDEDFSTLINGNNDLMVCNGLENGFLDGKGKIVRSLKFTLTNDDVKAPSEYTFQCEGFYARKKGEEPVYNPEQGHQYKVVGQGGKSNTTPLFTPTKCWPSFICDGEQGGQEGQQGGDDKHDDDGSEEPQSPSWDEAKSKAKAFVSKMSLDEKISLFTGKWASCVGNISPVNSVNFKGMCMQDGPAGIRSAGGHSVSWHASINTAATFNKDLMYKVGKAQGEENYESGINTFLAPCANILRTPQAGRIWEAYGEDPYLTGIAAEQVVRGIQDSGVIATIKHFVGNDQETSRECSSSNIEVRALMDVYVEPFYRSVKYAGVASVMIGYNAYNGTYCFENKYIMDDVLRGILGFKGFIVSDWWAVKNANPDALNNGLEVNMPGTTLPGKEDSYWSGIKDWVNQGKVSEERISEAAENIISAMYQLNQMDNFPQTNIQKETKTDERIALQRLTATESQVLLKNQDNILPLKGYKKIAVIGADAFPRTECQGQPDMKCARGHVPLGYGSGTTDFAYLIDPLQAIEKYGQSQGFTVVSSGRLDQNGKTFTEDINGGAQAARDADVAIVFVVADSGEEYIQLENSWGDRPDLDAWHGGNDLVEAVAKVNKNVVVVINGPGVINVPWLDSVKAVVFSGFPGMESGNAIADVLFGAANPSGHLPFVWGKIDEYGARINKIGGVKKEGDFDQYDYTEGLYVGQRWFNKKGTKAIFPFGWGLSYSKFSYKNLNLSMSKKGLEATFEVTNDSDIKGQAVPMLFLTFPDSIGDYPKYILKGFEKVELKGGETKKVTILSDAHALSVFDLSANNYVRVKKGTLKVAIAENGDPSQAILEDSIDASY